MGDIYNYDIVYNNIASSLVVNFSLFPFNQVC